MAEKVVDTAEVKVEDYGENLRRCLNESKKIFAKEFGGQAIIAVSAPGRVNLIGEHTDYNNGFVLPMALPRMTVVVGRKVADSPSSSCTIFSTAITDTTQRCRFPVPSHPGGDISQRVDTECPKWAKYVVGVVALMNQNGDVPAFEAVIHTCVPIGGGVSSSASLEVATAMFVQELRGRKEDPMKMALICQEAEHRYPGNPCGIMDQFVAVLGEEGCALMIDCSNQTYRSIPFNNPNLAVLVINSGVRHELAGGEYKKRRESCEAAASALMVSSLQSVSMEQLENGGAFLNVEQFRRARHVISEIARTEEAVQALRQRDYRRFGRLMNESHNSLRVDYEVSCRELDVLVNLAREIDGVYGSRMTGGGFGGCTVTLLPRSIVQDAICKIKERASEEDVHPTEFMVVTASPGAKVLNVDGEN